MESNMKRDVLELKLQSTDLLDAVIKQLSVNFTTQVLRFKTEKEGVTDFIKSEDIVSAVGFVTKYIYSNNPSIIMLEHALMEYLTWKNEVDRLNGECMRAITHMAKLHEAELERFVDEDNTTEEEVFKEYQAETGW